MGKRRGQPDICERFGDAIRNLREHKGMTQEELAHRARLNRTYVSDIERGSRNVSLINIERLASALGVTLRVLFDSISNK